MKKCPYCAEYIQDDANKCRYCKEWLSERDNHTDIIFPEATSSISSKAQSAQAKRSNSGSASRSRPVTIYFLFLAFLFYLLIMFFVILIIFDFTHSFSLTFLFALLTVCPIIFSTIGIIRRRPWARKLSAFIIAFLAFTLFAAFFQKGNYDRISDAVIAALMCWLLANLLWSNKVIAYFNIPKSAEAIVQDTATEKDK